MTISSRGTIAEPMEATMAAEREWTTERTMAAEMGWSIAETANQLGRPVGTVRSWEWRGAWPAMVSDWLRERLALHRAHPPPKLDGKEKD